MEPLHSIPLDSSTKHTLGVFGGMAGFWAVGHARGGHGGNLGSAQIWRPVGVSERAGSFCCA